MDRQSNPTGAACPDRIAGAETGAISVVIVTHDSLPTLDACLRALAPELRATGARLVVVDNASRDGSAGAVAAAIPDAVVIRNGRNHGFAAACNQGAARAGGEWLVFLNPDVVVDRGSLGALGAALREHPDAGFAAARLRSPSGRFQPSCRRFPTRGNLWRSRGSVLGRWQRGGAPYTLDDATEVTPVPAVACAFVMIRRDRFDALGGFDERFFVFMEDTDLSLRLERAGHPNLFVPAAGAVHHWARGSGAGKGTRAWHHHVSMWKYLRKHQPGAFSSFVAPVLLAGNLLVRLLAPRGARGSE